MERVSTLQLCRKWFSRMTNHLYNDAVVGGLYSEIFDTEILRLANQNQVFL